MIIGPTPCARDGSRRSEKNHLELRGPAINQMINPITGNTSTSKIQSTFAPFELGDPRIDTAAQTTRAR